MKKILIICPYPEDVAPGQRLKYEQYIDVWEENGYSVKVSSFMNIKMWNILYSKGNYVKKIYYTICGYSKRLYDLLIVRNYDIIYIFLWVTPLGTSFFERAFRILAKYVIYDIEDNILLKQKSVNNRIVDFLRGAGKILFLIKKSDYVITSSPFLNDYCFSINEAESCKYISSSVDTSKFVPSNAYTNNKNKITIGWTGTFSSKRHLDSLRDVFLELNKRCNFRLYVIGNFDFVFPEIDLEVVQWDKETEVRDMQFIDIGIYPLIDDEWVKGKSGLKAIQYMAFGLPTVASNVGNTPNVITNLENGWLVDSDEEWVLALETLINNPILRRKLGLSARNTAIQKYSKDAISSEYLSVLDIPYSRAPENNG